MAGLFASILGAGKLLTNVLGGGAGSTTNQNSNQTQNTVQNATEQSSTKSSTDASRKEFSDGMLQLLEGTSANAVIANSKTTDALNDRIAGVNGQFDSQAYIDSIVGNAKTIIGGNLTADINKTAADVGGSSTGNSMTAQLAGKLRADAGANLGTIQADATARAAELEANKTSQLVQLDQSTQGSLATLLTALKGGETYQSVDSAENSASKSSTTGTNTTVGSTTQKTPFNWTKGLGNLFADIDQTK
jgi:hypothetical protein